MLLGGCCFIVFSEQLSPRRYVVSSLRQMLLTEEDIRTYVEMAYHLGVIITPSCGRIVTEALKSGGTWKFIEDITSQAYARQTKTVHNRPDIKTIEYYLPFDVHYQVGTDRRLLMAYSIRYPWTEDGNLYALRSYQGSILYECDSYLLCNDRLHVKQKKNKKPEFVFNRNDFPSLF